MAGPTPSCEKISEKLITKRLAESKPKSLGVSNRESVASTATMSAACAPVPKAIQNQPMKARSVRVDDRSAPGDDAGGDVAASVSSRPSSVMDCLQLYRVHMRIDARSRYRARPHPRGHSTPRQSHEHRHSRVAAARAESPCDWSFRRAPRRQRHP